MKFIVKENTKVKENLKSSNDDGWGEEIESILSEFMNDAYDLQYEVENETRGKQKVHDLLVKLDELKSKLELSIEDIESREKELDEGKVEEELKVCKDNDIELYPEMVWKLADDFFDRCKIAADEMDYSTPSKINNLGDTADSVIAEFRNLSTMANDIADKLSQNKDKLNEHFNNDDII